MKYILLLLIIISISGCEIDKCLQSAGEPTSHETKIDSFTNLTISGILDIELVPDSVDYLEVSGGENIVEGFDHEIKDNCLYLYNYNTCAWAKSYEEPKVRLHFRNLGIINIEEACHLYSKDSLTGNVRVCVKTKVSEIDLLLNTTTFSIYNNSSCGGSFKFSGKTVNLNISGYYCAIYDAEDLQCKKASIKNHSIVDYKVWVEDMLNVEIYNSGNIFYKGNPGNISIDSVVSTGQLLPL